MAGSEKTIFELSASGESDSLNLPNTSIDTRFTLACVGCAGVVHRRKVQCSGISYEDYTTRDWRAYVMFKALVRSSMTASFH